jgi:hypothetical protein
MGPIFSYPSPQVYNKPAPAAEPEFGTFPRIPRTNVSGVTRDLCRFARLVPPAGGDFREDDAGAASDGAVSVGLKPRATGSSQRSTQ